MPSTFYMPTSHFEGIIAFYFFIAFGFFVSVFNFIIISFSESLIYFDERLKIERKQNEETESEREREREWKKSPKEARNDCDDSIDKKA